ncbi:MAG: hypothetical protein GWP44_10450 [Proteobacteria bacterium]|nr:hypothetical protein [Pseudomonadota bacterium]
MSSRLSSVLLCLALAVSGCASASDRLAEGIELQNEGRYLEAAYRYADAVDKDDELVQARELFVAVSDTAVMLAMKSADDLVGAGDPIRAAEAFRRTDALFARGREVGVGLTPPADYNQLRRQSFDDAIDGLMQYAASVAADGEMRDAQRALRRARSDFGASSAQREASVAAEIDLLLDWAEYDLGDRYYKAAFARAGEAVDLQSPPTRGTVRRADDIRNEALDLGMVRIAILPLTSRSDVRDSVGSHYQDELSDNLEIDYWVTPPPCVAVANSALVRGEARDAASGGRPLNARQVSRVMDAVGSDLGALIEVTYVSMTDQNVRRTSAWARKRDGELVPWTLERGRYVLEVRAEVIVVDRDGDELERFVESGRETGGFERGVYGENPRELQLSSNESRYFDPDLLEKQRAEVQQAALEELAEQLADRLFREVIDRVR